MSTGLVYSLHRQRAGRHSMRELIVNLGRLDMEPRQILSRYFPGFRESKDAIDKWWALEMALLAQGSAFEYYNADETEMRLAELLEITFVPKGLPVRGCLGCWLAGEGSSSGGGVTNQRIVRKKKPNSKRERKRPSLCESSLSLSAIRIGRRF